MEEEFQFVRGHLMNNLNVFEYHKKTLDMIKALDAQIERLTEETSSPGVREFKNPREEASYLHNVKTLSVIKRQRERMTGKLDELQQRLQADMNAASSVTPLKPLN